MWFTRSDSLFATAAGLVVRRYLCPSVAEMGFYTEQRKQASLGHCQLYSCYPHVCGKKIQGPTLAYLRGRRLGAKCIFCCGPVAGESVQLARCAVVPMMAIVPPQWLPVLYSGYQPRGLEVCCSWY